MSHPHHRAVIGCALAVMHFTNGCTNPSPPLSAWPPISGLAEIAPNSFVVVNDSKPGSGAPAIGFVSIGKDAASTTYAPISLHLEPPPNDLEAIDAVPGSPMILIALESGGLDAPRRALLLQVTLMNGAAQARLLGSPIDIRAATSAMSNVEALAIESGDVEAKRATVLVADRTPLNGDGPVDVTVARVALDFATGGAESLGTACTFTFARPEQLGPAKGQWRACSDIAIERSGNLLVTAASDDGSRGPFASLIYRVDRSKKSKITELARIDGLKVEGLALSNDKKRAWIGSDDEALGGVLRSLAIGSR